MDGLGNWHNLGFVKPVLHIGSTTFAFADADEQAGAFVQWYCVDDDDVGWSDGAMLTVKIVLVNEPSAPRNLAATVASATEIGLSWAAPAQTGGADITGYEYRYSTDGGDNWGAWTAIASSASLTGYTVSGLDTTSTHTFQLRAVNSSGAGPHADMGETASTDASLSGLSLSAGTLTPAFAAATTSYAATVANTVSRVTVTPVRNHTGATVAYLDGSDAALADADPNTDHQQVDLVIGPNTIKVQVTAEDGDDGADLHCGGHAHGRTAGVHQRRHRRRCREHHRRAHRGSRRRRQPGQRHRLHARRRRPTPGSSPWAARPAP